MCNHGILSSSEYMFFLQVLTFELCIFLLYWLLKPTCILQSPYGDGVEPEKAPEAISKAVASLPPEQMFELMKQMKVYMIKVEGLTI